MTKDPTHRDSELIKTGHMSQRGRGGGGGGGHRGTGAESPLPAPRTDRSHHATPDTGRSLSGQFEEGDEIAAAALRAPRLDLPASRRLVNGALADAGLMGSPARAAADTEMAEADRVAMPPPPVRPQPATAAPPDASTAQERVAVSKEDKQRNNLEKLKKAGYVRITQSGLSPRVKIDAYRVIAAYHDAAADTDIEIALIPEEGVGLGVGQFGPWTIYMEYEIARAFADEVPLLSVEGVGLTIEARRLIDEERVEPTASFAIGPTITPYLQEKGCWLEIQIEEGLAFKTVTRVDIKRALKDMGLEVFRGARGQVKMPTEEGAEYKDWQPMGSSMETDRTNFTVLPKEGTVETFPWPPTIKVVSDHVGMSFDLKYRMGGKAAEGMHGAYGGCKGPLAQCQCPKVGGMPRGQREREAFERREETRKRKAEDANEAFLLMLNKPQRPCPHLIGGRCKSGSRCTFLHPDREECAKIECKRPKSSLTGICDASPHCIYSPCVSMQRASTSGYRFGVGQSPALLR